MIRWDEDVEKREAEERWEASVDPRFQPDHCRHCGDALTPATRATLEPYATVFPECQSCFAEAMRRDTDFE